MSLGVLNSTNQPPGKTMVWERKGMEVHSRAGKGNYKKQIKTRWILHFRTIHMARTLNQTYHLSNEL